MGQENKQRKAGINYWSLRLSVIDKNWFNFNVLHITWDTFSTEESLNMFYLTNHFTFDCNCNYNKVVNISKLIWRTISTSSFQDQDQALTITSILLHLMELIREATMFHLVRINQTILISSYSSKVWWQV